MRLSHTIAPALAALLASACSGYSRHASAPERAEQAEDDKVRAQDDAHKARLDAEKARIDAQDATRTQREAEQKSQFSAQAAARAERDAQQSPRPGVTALQPVEPQGTRYVVAVAAPDLGVSFAANSDDLTRDEKANLNEIANTQHAHPSKTVFLEGYSDDSGADSTDPQLSRRRVDAVARYLQSKGVPSKRIVTTVGSRNPDVKGGGVKLIIK
jgi:outer membrane protein OmpA-like peptidoglycan-associated protein